jgi:hypothetical protein
MNSTNCKLLQREMDDLDLDQQLGNEAIRHLNECAECRRFRDEHRALRALVGSLEAVSAPPDFDFRLRARLSREKQRANFDLHAAWVHIRPLAAAAMVLLITVAGIMVKSRVSRNRQTTTIEVGSLNKNNESAGTTNTSPSPDPKGKGREFVANVPPNNEPVARSSDELKEKRNNRLRRSAEQKTAGALAMNNRPSVTREQSLSPAPLVKPTDSSESGPGVTFVRLDAKPLKLSVDNGRGGERTISFPTVSFGSQPMLTRSASFMPVSSTRGVW